MKILFVTSRNVVNTCGELRLIKNRAESLYGTDGIITDFIVFRRSKCRALPREEIGCESTMSLHLYSQKNPFSIISKRGSLKREVFDRLAAEKYGAVVLSGNMVLYLSKKIKKLYPEIKLIIDVHGAAEELVEFKGKSLPRRLLRRAIYSLFKSQERRNMKNADAFFAVSERLKAYLTEEYGVGDKRFFIVPCAQGRGVINVAEKQKCRAQYREAYGVRDDEILFVYSGGLSPWQCIEESVELFKRISEQIPNCKMAIFTGNKSAVEKYRSERVIVDSLPFDKVNDVICAGDFAFMLREDYVTNNVAYPNKFIEYVASGMKVIATPFVDDVARQIKDFGVGVITQDGTEAPIDYIRSAVPYMADVEGRQRLLDDVCFENRLSEFFEFAGGK